eukprot:4961262-Prorocentrum_lima.AAC.1
MTSSLVGSEMCIRDSPCGFGLYPPPTGGVGVLASRAVPGSAMWIPTTVSYTHLTLPTICSV